MSYAYLVLAKALLILVVCIGGATSCIAQSFARDTDTQARTKARYVQIERQYLSGERTAECDREALVAGEQWLREGLNARDANVAAEKVFRLTDLALRLSAQRTLLYTLADSVYLHRNSDSSRANRGQLLLAVACLELNRGDYHLCKATIDSAILQGGGVLLQETLASCYAIRGYANSRLGKHHDSYRDFARSAAVYKELGEVGGQITGLEASAREAVVIGEFGEALAATERAIAHLAAIPNGEADLPEAFNVYLSRAKALAAVGRRDEALVAVRRGAAIAEVRQDAFRIIAATVARAEVEAAIGRLGESIRMATLAVASASEHNQDQLHFEALTILRDAQKADRRYAAALATATRMLELKDTIDAHRLNYGLEDLRVRHRHQAIQHDLTLLDAERRAVAASRASIRSERRALGVLALAGVALVAVFFQQLRTRRHAQLRLQRLVEERTAEIAAQKADLLAQAEHLRRSNAELERFAYIASHDLKTPIRNVTSFLGLIERRLAPTAKTEVQEYLDLAQGYARQMHALVTDVLEFSKLDIDLDSRSSAVPLAGMLDHIGRQLAPQFEARGGALEITGGADAWGPPNYLSQLFTNLVENGLKYNRSVCPRVQVRIEAIDERWVEIRVEDNGIGIAPAYHDRVFEMFKRLHTTDEFQGTGLGLAVCKKVVDRLGGSIVLESEEGEGSTFTVRLPAKRTLPQVGRLAAQRVSAGVEA